MSGVWPASLAHANRRHARFDIFRTMECVIDMESHMPDLLLSDTSPLRLSDSVGVIIKTEDNQYLLQHRWNRPGLYFPGFWGLFGGGVKQGEQPRQAARRELEEELNLDISSLELVMQFNFDFVPMGRKKIGRWFFLTLLSRSDVTSISLSEGVAIRAFSPAEALDKLKLVYYDAFALWALESRQRLL
jgi:8-oxo-dGTP pyrophosphatase MutT (NUDIX family)